MGSPFDSGKTLVFKSMSTAGGTKKYLDSSPNEPMDRSVYLIDSIDFTAHTGTHWESIMQAAGIYRLRSMSGINRTILDSSSAVPRNASVFVNTDNAGIGSHWTPNQLADGSYSLESQTPSGQKHFISADVTASQEASVYLVDNSNAIGTHWMVGVDHYTRADIRRIVTNAFPGTHINFFHSDRNYGSLTYEILHGIWNDSGLGNYQGKQQKFDCDDFSVCMKAAVSKYSYNQTLPIDKGSLCGIIYARVNPVVPGGRPGHAFNFTIDPFENLILFEPQSGQSIPHGQYTPYLCIV